ncbi:hypothetical protein [Muriicola marianensis]|uniref:Oligosaccharide repeat unit polymerase n=1 Tax=Muriicola marianensis TaxID=1324801 RepID=A0ABQ1QZJ4_9FLAO|nr:hypothetical protein [Muriicola marianensis]GGD49827.1 hypothetical protein GCM10011361_15650 [Muriicola marianensis]
MKGQSLYIHIQFLLVALAIAIFTLGYTYFTLFTGLFILATSYPAFRLPKNTFIFYLIIALAGASIAGVMIGIDAFPDAETKNVLLRIRYFLIRILFAMSVCIFLMRFSLEKILYLAYLIMLIHLIAGLYQLVFLDAKRIYMLTSEPSAAAMYYVFLAPLMIGYYNINKGARFWIILFLITGLLTQSKALFLVVPVLIFYFVIRSENKKIKTAFWIIVIAGVLAAPFIIGLHEVERLIYFIEILKEQGIEGLTEQNRIWSTFTLRFSSVLTALQLMIEFPWGIGFGGFHSMYIDKMLSDSIQSTLTGVEIRGILNGELYATPKSIFLEYAVSCGIFFWVPILMVSRKALSGNVPVTIKASFIGLILISLIVELSPFLTFLGFIMILLHKLSNENNRLLV